MLRLLTLMACFSASLVQSQDYRVIWNSPTESCFKYGLNLTEDLLKAGVEVNEGGRFKGDKLTILYDPGLFPSLEGGSVRNGGVPQEADLAAHLAAFDEAVGKLIPDQGFRGLGVIDFEDWRPIWRQNWGKMDSYRKYSRGIEKKRHPSWNEEAIEKAARQRFEKSAEGMMSATLRAGRRARPGSLWGYYGFPKCFNFTPNNNKMTCDPETRSDNDKSMRWMGESGALFPSVYLRQDLSEPKRAKLIQGKVEEAVRVGSAYRLPVFPYAAYKYQDNKEFLSKGDMKSSLLVPKRYGASGVVLWGSSKDVGSGESCGQLQSYVRDVLGPLAKQAGSRKRLSDPEQQPDSENEIP